MFDFLFGRKKTKAPATPVSYDADYPEAVTLGARHYKEQAASTLWLADKSIAPPTQEELDAMEPDDVMARRQEAELTAATCSLSDLGKLRFQTVYTQERTKQIQASTERMKANMAPEAVKRMEDREAEAKRVFAEYLEGKPQAQDIQDAISRGLLHGKRVAQASESERQAVIKEVSTESMDWQFAEVKPSDLAVQVCGLAMSKGMEDVYQERRKMEQANPTATHPSRLPFLENAPFGALRVESITFIAGRLGKGKGHYLANGKILVPGGEFMFPLNAVKGVELATQERVAKVSGALGWGLVGGSLLGPAGAIVGGLLGGQKEEMTYLVTFSEEHRILISSSAKVYQQMLGAAI